MAIKQYEIYWINLDPTIGSEIQKTRPGTVIFRCYQKLANEVKSAR